MSATAKPSAAPSANLRVELRGIERYGTMLDTVSIKCNHSVLVSGEVETLLHFLPTVLMNTFNRHPRMRLMVVKGESFTGEIRPPITLDTVTESRLLRVREFGDSEEDAAAWETWKEFVPQECELPIDRYTEYLFYLTVWVNKKAGLARLMLFSDHIVSDGDSGLVVINDVLEQVSQLSNKVVHEIIELPLQPSLYDMWFSPSWWLKPVAKTLLYFFARSTFVSYAKSFKPVLAPGADQHDFALPVKQNRTHGLFAEGDPACLRKTLDRCKEEKVSFAGALIPIVVLAFYHARRKQKGFEASENDDLFKLAAEVNYNMRARVANSGEEPQVGMYVTIAAMPFLAKEGVDMRTAKFWDLARHSRTEITKQGEQQLLMGLPCFMLDSNLNSEAFESFLGDARVPSSVYGDVNISSVGRYPFPKEHTLADNGALHVENMHTFCTVPFIASSATMWISSVKSFSYSLGHKCEDDVGKELFKAYVAVCENAGSIGPDDTMLDVLQRLEAAGEL